MDATRRSAYLHDFEAQIREVDMSVFGKGGHPLANICIFEERPHKAGGYHVLDLASYYPQLPLVFVSTPNWHKKKATRKTISVNAYAIYAPMLEQFVERTLERSTLSGNGDQAIATCWAIFAVTLTRFRVLAHKEFFPNVKLRTIKSMLKYRLLFTEGDNEIEGCRNIEQQFAKLTTKHRSDAYNVDIFWTIQLVDRALACGHTFDEALAYITTS